MSAVIGIAFGNTSSSIAYANQDGKVEVIANPDGDRAIPSVMSYVGHDEYQGAQAKAQLIRHPRSTIANFRDYIGKKFDDIDASVSEFSAHPLSKDGKVVYKIPITKINEDGESETIEEEISVEEITARHLKTLKAAAEDYIGKPVEGAVLTVPTNCSEHEKAVLLQVAKSIDLNILQLINEPSAALLAHTASISEEALLEDKVYLVADFGGSRSDGAIIAIRGGILTILATSHDYELGGNKLDDALVEFFAKEFEKKYKANPRSNERSLAKLKAESADTRKTLSNVTSATISIDSLADGYDFHTTINRMRFELVARSALNQMTTFVESLVKKADLDVLDIDEVLLVGGTSFTPKLASNISFLFPESTVVVSPSTNSKAVDPSELIARGAALQASMLEPFDQDEITESLQPVVVNASHLQKEIGILDAAGKFISIVSLETAIPIRKSIKLKSAETKGDLLIEIYEGKRNIKITKVEKPAKGESNDDDESDWSDEEEEDEEIREKEILPGTKLGELILRNVEANSVVEIVANATREGQLHISAKSGSQAVRGDISPK